MHLYMSLRRTIHIITSEDATWYLRTVQCDEHVTTNVCRCLGITQTTAIDIAIYSTLIQVDLCFPIVVHIIEYHWITATLAGIHATLRTTAIDMAVDDGITGIDRRLGIRLSSDIHRHIAVYQRRLTIAATKDRIRSRCAYHTTYNRHRGVLLQYTIGIATAINSLNHSTAFHRHLRVFEVLGCDTLNSRNFHVSNFFGACNNFCIFSCIKDFSCSRLSQTTAKDVITDSTTIYIDCCGIHRTLGTTAIDIVAYFAATTQDSLSFCTYIYSYRTAHDSLRTLTTAIDVGSHLT